MSDLRAIVRVIVSLQSLQGNVVCAFHGNELA